MNILLTGGAGYIGSPTALALKAAGFVPVVLDSLVTGHKWAVSYGPFVQGDVGDRALVKKVCEEYRPAAVIHFAAFIEVGESVENPAKYMENNFHKASRFFDAALDAGVDKIVFSSTAAVYGTPEDERPIPETHPLRPINPYGESKLAAENYLRGLVGMRSVALRYFNAAGAAPLTEQIGEAHEPETHLIPNVIFAGLKAKGSEAGGLSVDSRFLPSQRYGATGRGNDTLRIFGTDYPTPDGTAVRDYVHVMDLAAAHIAALRYLLGGGATDVCNLGTGRGFSVQEIVTAVESVLGSSVPCQREGRRAGDPARLVADSSKAKTLLGWEAVCGLGEIVESAVGWHRSRLEARGSRLGETFCI
jgi:UDP-arabinose 4-epimerase